MAVRTGSLSMSDEPREPFDDTSILARGGLNNHISALRENSATKEFYELLWYPNTYDLPEGLALGNHSSSPLSVAVELSGRRVLPFLDPSPPPSWGGLPFLISPSCRGSIFFFFLVFGEGVRRRVIGRRVRRRLASGTLLSSLGLLGLLRHLIRGRSQHLRQKSVCGAFG